MAKAGRIYLQLDVTYYEDAKVCDLSPMAELLYIRCLCACKRIMTDGVLSFTQIRRIGADLCDVNDDFDAISLTQELVAAGLMEGELKGSLTIPSWRNWNRSVNEIEEVSEARSAAGRIGGLNSGRSRRLSKQTGTKLLQDDRSKHEANETLLANPETETETETETEKRRVKTSVPETFEITDHLKEWATSNGINVDLESQTHLFLDNHAAKGSKFVDWNRAWMTWMRNRSNWDKDRGSSPGNRQQTGGVVNRSRKDSALGDVQAYRDIGQDELADQLQAQIDRGDFD